MLLRTIGLTSMIMAAINQQQVEVLLVLYFQPLIRKLAQEWMNPDLFHQFAKVDVVLMDHLTGNYSYVIVFKTFSL